MGEMKPEYNIQGGIRGKYDMHHKDGDIWIHEQVSKIFVLGRIDHANIILAGPFENVEDAKDTKNVIEQWAMAYYEGGR